MLKRHISSCFEVKRPPAWVCHCWYYLRKSYLRKTFTQVISGKGQTPPTSLWEHVALITVLLVHRAVFQCTPPKNVPRQYGRNSETCSTLMYSLQCSSRACCPPRTRLKSWYICVRSGTRFSSSRWSSPRMVQKGHGRKSALLPTSCHKVALQEQHGGEARCQALLPSRQVSLISR